MIYKKKPDVIKITIIIAVIMLVLLLAYGAKGAEPYGYAEFHNPVYYPTQGIVGEWKTMSPGLSGDKLQGNGQFEGWDTSPGSCTDCPDGWVCVCSSGDMDQSSTIIYKGSRSLYLESANLFALYLSHPFEYEANKTYLFRIRYISVDGTEDILMAQINSAATDMYLPATDTWGGGFAVFSDTNVSNTAWTTFYGLIDVGPVAKVIDYWFVLGPQTSDGTGFYIDDFEIWEAGSNTVVGTRGNQMSIVGDPGFGTLPVRTSTGPVSDQGMEMNAGANYLVEATDTDQYDPITFPSAGSFSIGCKFVTSSVTPGAQQTLISKFVTGGGQQSWNLMQNIATNDIYFLLSDDGTNTTLITDQTSVGANREHSVLVTYKNNGGALNNDAILEVDFNTPITSAVFRGPPHNSTGTMKIGAREAGSYMWDGKMYHCVMWNDALDAVERSKWHNPYYPGVRRSNRDGTYVTDCNRTAPHANCSYDYCRESAPNSCTAELTGSLASFASGTQLLVDNSWQTNGGTQIAPNWPDWSESEFPGAGSAGLTAYYGDTVHGDTAVRSVTTASDSNTRLTSACITVTPSTAYTLYMKSQKFSGTAVIIADAYEYSGGGCTGYITASHFVVNEDSTVGTWTEHLGTATMNVATNSVQVVIYPTYNSAADLIIDAASFTADSFRIPWVENPNGSVSTTFTDTKLEVLNPLTYYESGAYNWVGGWCVPMWVYTDWAGNDGVIRSFLYITPTAAANNQVLLYKNAGGSFRFEVDDSVGGIKRMDLVGTTTNWTAGTWKYIEACTDNTGTIQAHHYNTNNSTWYDWSSASGAGTGIVDDQHANMDIGNTAGTSQLEGYIYEFGVYPYDAGYTNVGFNNGISPPLPY